MKEILMDLFMIFGPSINYLFQIFKFKKTKSSKGFSTYLCLVTILSHTFRIFFWLIEKFKKALLIQSILVVIMQLYLIYLCIKYKELGPDYDQETINDIEINKISANIFCDWRKTLNIKLIWKWKNIIEYYKFYFFVVFLLFLLYFCCDNTYYSNVVGSLSVFLEIISSFPLIIELYRTKNQKNISKIMVLMWFIGNSLKVFYNIYNKSPIQLIVGSYIQVLCNIILVTQIIYYYYLDIDKKSDGIITNITEPDNSNKIIFDGNNEISPNNNEKIEINDLENFIRPK